MSSPPCFALPDESLHPFAFYGRPDRIRRQWHEGGSRRNAAKEKPVSSRMQQSTCYYWHREPSNSTDEAEGA